MKILLYFFARYLLAPLFVAVMISKKRIRLGRLDIHDIVLYPPWSIVLQTVNLRFVRSNRYWQLPNSYHSHSNHDMRFRRMVLLSAV